MKRRYDPKRIADSLRDLGEDDQVLAAPEETDESEQSGATEESFAGYMEKTVLPSMEENVRIDAVPRGTRFEFLKRLAHRALRIVSAKQVSYNFFTFQAVRSIVDRLADVGKALRDHETGISRLSVETARRLDEIWDDLSSRLEIQRSALARLSEQVHAREQARRRQAFRLFQSEKERKASPADDGDRTPATGLSERADDGLSEIDETGYLAFEDVWRGPPELIRQSQEEHVRILRPYLEKLELKKRIVLDIGCGPGHFLDALVCNGINCIGVDVNRAAVVEAQKKGLSVECEEGASYLAFQADNKFGAITALQVVEHLSPAALRRLIDLIHDKLAPGGIAMFETLNPATFAAYRWFLMDLTHERLMTPETLRFVCECAGLEHVETRLMHPVADHERLSETGSEDEKANIRRLNEVLFGYQDYILLARKPLPAEEDPKP